MDKEMWIEIAFDGVLIDNIIAKDLEEAKEIILSVEQNGFSDYNEEVKNDWLEMGFRNNPKVTACLTK